MSAFSGQSHLYLPVDMVPNFLTNLVTLSVSTVVGYEGASSARSDEEPDKRHKPFNCSDCCKRFASLAGALDDITEMDMIPINVRFPAVVSNGVAHTITGIAPRGSIN